MTKITLKIAQNGVLAAMFLSTAAFAAPAHNNTLYAPVAKQTVATPQAKVACDALEGAPDCRNGFMPRP